MLSYGILKASFSSLIVMIITCIGFFSGEYTTGTSNIKTDSCWNRVKVLCNKSTKEVKFGADKAPPVFVAKGQAIDSLGIIVEVKDYSDSIIIIKKHTGWMSDERSNGFVFKIVAIDSIVENYRWDCEYAGPGKGNCSECQVKDCEGNNIGNIKRAKAN